MSRRDPSPSSALRRCLQRHGVSQLPIEETKEQRKWFKTYEIGYVHIDSCESRHADGRLVMFLAIDRVSKFTYVEFHGSAGKMERSAFLSNAVQVFPYKIHTALTDNGMAFADLPKNREGPSCRFLGPHTFDRVCMKNGIEHRLTKPYHPWINGQAESTIVLKSGASRRRSHVTSTLRRHSRPRLLATTGRRLSAPAAPLFCSAGDQRLFRARLLALDGSKFRAAASAKRIMGRREIAEEHWPSYLNGATAAACEADGVNGLRPDQSIGQPPRRRLNVRPFRFRLSARGGRLRLPDGPNPRPQVVMRRDSTRQAIAQAARSSRAARPQAASSSPATCSRRRSNG